MSPNGTKTKWRANRKALMDDMPACKALAWFSLWW